MTHFLKSLIEVSEKAANIARVCRQDKHLFKLLVQEKKEEEKNPKFVQDFKTLADVLIQETIKHDIGTQFPAIAPYIRGEESNKFSNTLGESICVVVQEDEASTAALLCQVLNGDTTAAELLAAEVHKTIESDSVNLSHVPESVELPMTHLGMWIDPIDSTGEYIGGEEAAPDESGIHNGGLPCVTVLIGVFDRRTGEPVLGVVNQPFHTLQDSQWAGRCFWGVSWGEERAFSAPAGPAPAQPGKVVVLSSSESDALKASLQSAGYQLVEAAGAGYKCLVVALGLAAVYVLSRNTTFRWDTCGPHALLRAQGGGVARFLPAEQGIVQQLSYREWDSPDTPRSIMVWCNTDGVVAYRDPAALQELLAVLQER